MIKLDDTFYFFIAFLLLFLFVMGMLFYIQSEREAKAKENPLYQSGMVCNNEVFDLVKLKIVCNTGLTGETVFSLKGHSNTKFDNGVECSTKKIRSGYFKTECSNGIVGETLRKIEGVYVTKFNDGIQCEITKKSPFRSVTVCT